MPVRIGPSIDNSARLAMAEPRQFRQLIFRSGIYIHEMMGATVPAVAYSFSSCLRLIRCFRSRFPNFSAGLFQRGLSTLRRFCYLVSCAFVASPLVCRVTVIIATTRQDEHKKNGAEHWKLGNFMFSHVSPRDYQHHCTNYFDFACTSYRSFGCVRAIVGFPKVAWANCSRFSDFKPQF